MQKMPCPYHASHPVSFFFSLCSVQVPSLTHHSSCAVLNRFIRHSHPSPLRYLLTSELPTQGRKRILHVRGLVHPLFHGILLGKPLDVCHHGATVAPTVPSASALLLFLQALLRICKKPDTW